MATSMGRSMDGAKAMVPSIPLALVWVVALGFTLGGLSSFGLLDNNEGLYGEVAREMLVSRDGHQWVIPPLNGLPYMEKPPLLYWLTAFSFSLFGESEWAARLVPALSSLACVTMLLWFGKAVQRPQAGRLAALMFSSGIGVVAMSHLLVFDMLLTALFSAALMHAFLYRSTGRIARLRWSYAFLALAVLTKGLVAPILYGLVMVVSTFADSFSGRGMIHGFDKWTDRRALLIFLAIAMPWHIAAALIEPIFTWLYFINEQVLRFLGKREPHDYYSGSWWYYLPRMVIYLFPWSFLLFSACTSMRFETTAHPLTRFLTAAWLVPLLFFTVSVAKANYYLIVVMPFVAFQLALAIENRAFMRPLARALPGVSIAIVAMALGGVFMMRDESAFREVIVIGLTQRQFLYLLFGGVAVLAGVAAASAARFARLGILSYLVLPAWIASGLIVELHAMEPEISTRVLAHQLQNTLSNRELFVYRSFEGLSSLPFYMKRPIPVVDAHSNDLFWGNKVQVNRILIPRDMFRSIARTSPVVIVVRKQQLANFRAVGLDRLFRQEKMIGDTMVFFN